MFNCLGSIAPRSVLDVGTGRTALPALLRSCGYRVTAIDNIRDYWPQGMLNQHFHVLDDDILSSQLTDHFDVVLCISVLEHIARYDTALAAMTALTRPGGHLIITIPFHEQIGSVNVYEEPGSYGQKIPYICRQFTRQDLASWLGQGGVTLVKQEWWQFFESHFWSCGKQLAPPRRATPEEPHQHTCLLIRRDG